MDIDKAKYIEQELTKVTNYWLSVGLLLGALVIRNGKLVLTPRGRYHWVVLMGTLFSVVGDYRNLHASIDTTTVLLPKSRSRPIYNLKWASS